MTLHWLKQGAFAIADQIAFSGAGFALSLMIGRWLTPREYGAYALAFSVFLFASSFHNSIVLEPMGVLGPALFRDVLPRYIARLVRIHTWVALVLSVLILVGSGIVFLFLTSADASIALALCGASLAVPFVLLSWLLRQAAYLDHRPALALCGGLTYAIVLSVTAISLASLGRINAFTAFVPSITGGIAAAAVMTWLIRPDFTPHLSVETRVVLTRHWRYGKWVIYTAFVYWLSGQAYYFITAAFLGINDVALVRAVQNFLLPLSQFMSCLSMLAMPLASARFAANDNKGFRSTIAKISGLFAGAGAIYFVSICLAGPILLKLVYAGRYGSGIELLPYMALSGAAIAAAQGPVVGLRAMQSPSGVFAGYTVSGVFAVVAGIAMTRMFGLKGAVASMALGSFCFLAAVVVRYLLLLKKSERKPDFVRQDAVSSSARVAWLLPSMARAFYWQPLLKAFSTHIPESIIFTGCWPGTLPQHEDIDVRVVPGLDFIILETSKEGYNSGIFRAPISVLWKLLRYRPTTVFVAGFSLWSGFAILVKAVTGCRVIILWEGMSPSVTFLDSFLRLKTRKVLGKLADGGVSNMRAGVAYLRDSLGMCSSKLWHQLYEVPDLSTIQSGPQPAALREMMARPRFLFVGSLIPRKGCRYLVRAAEVLVEQGYELFSILLIGNGPEEDEIRETVRVRNLEQFVRLTPAVEYSSLGACFEACDVFVFPTLEDTWGLVVLEALASGKPVLCSKYAGSAELIRQHNSGFLFDPRDMNDLSNCMKRFIEDPGLIRRMGDRAAESMAPHTPKAAARMLAAIATGILPLEMEQISEIETAGVLK